MLESRDERPSRAENEGEHKCGPLGEHDCSIELRGGELDATLRAVLMANSRTPGHLEADLQAQWVAADLALDFEPALAAAIDGRAVGLGVYNAAQAYLGPLVEQPIDDLLAVVDVNCRGPVRFVRLNIIPDGGVSRLRLIGRVAR